MSSGKVNSYDFASVFCSFMQKVYFRTRGHTVYCTGRRGSATPDRCPLSGTTPPQTVCSTTGRLSCRDRRQRERLLLVVVLLVLVVEVMQAEQNSRG